jgi:hypothetical protein
VTEMQTLAVAAMYAAIAGLVWSLTLRDLERNYDSPKRGYREVDSILDQVGTSTRQLTVVWGLLWPLSLLMLAVVSIDLAITWLRGRRG